MAEIKNYILFGAVQHLSAAALQSQVKYKNFEEKFKDEKYIWTPMLVGQNLVIVHICTLYQFQSRPKQHLAI